MRGQANLPAVAVALLVVTTATGLSLVIADTAFGSAERDATDRAVASSVADRLVAADGPISERRNVLDVSRLDGTSVESVVPSGVDARIVVGDETMYERGRPTGGQTVRRLAVLADRQTVTLEPRLRFGSVTLPRRSPNATITVDADADVTTVRANGRVVLYDSAGIDGGHEVSLSRYETATLRFDGEWDTDDVTVTYHPRQTRKALLEVTVDA